MMLRVLTAFLICAAAHAATQTTTLAVSGSVTNSGTAFVVTGPASFAGQFTGNGTFSSTIPFSAALGGGTTVAISYTITLTGGTLVGTTACRSSRVGLDWTGHGRLGLGKHYQWHRAPTLRYTGTFPSLSGQGGINTTTGAITFTLSGSGTITTGGTVAPASAYHPGGGGRRQLHGEHRPRQYLRSARHGPLRRRPGEFALYTPYVFWRGIDHVHSRGGRCRNAGLPDQHVQRKQFQPDDGRAAIDTGNRQLQRDRDLQQRRQRPSRSDRGQAEARHVYPGF